MENDMRADLDCATQIARETGHILLEYFRSDHVNAREKGERDVVTAADEAAERLAVGRLRDAFPNDGLVAEEGSRTKTTSGRVWYLDPLDGTLNFARGLPLWCVSLALFVDHVPALGVVYDPLREELFSAAAGTGAWRNGLPIRSGVESSLASAFVHVTVDFRDDSMILGLEDLTCFAPEVYRTRNIGSVALALAYVASGTFDVLIHRHAQAWDYGAGVALVTEAGGVISALAGTPYHADEVSLLAASNASLHRQALALLRGASKT